MQPADRNGTVESAKATRGERLLWLLPVFLAAWRFHPITRNYFYGDDLYNLYEIVNRGLVEYLIKPYGMHLLAARNTVFFVCYELFGTSTAPYFWVVLLTHALNVFLLFDILRLFTGPWLACLGALLWGLSPVDEGALGWFSVYGQVLATTLILWVLRRLAQVANGRSASRLAPWRWAALLVVAAMSFGTGIGAAMVFPLVALILLPASRVRRHSLAAFAAVAVALPFLYTGLHRIAQMYHAPNTGMMGHPLAVLRVLPGVSVLTFHLVACGLTNLLLNPFWDPVPYPSPVSYAVAAAAGIAAVATLIVSDPARRRQLLAVLALGLACYGIIAVGRISFFSVLGTRIVTSARYHYAATAFLSAAVLLMLATAVRRHPLPRRWASAFWAAALALNVLPYALLPHPIDHHDQPRAAAKRALSDIQRGIGAAPPGADVVIQNRRFNGVGPLMFNRPDLFPGLAGVFAVYFPKTVVDGRRVFFVLTDRKALAAARTGRKSARFVLGPGEAPPPLSADRSPKGGSSP
jgi:hypothetical protein